MKSKEEARKLIKEIIKSNPEYIVDFIEAHADFTNNLNYEIQRTAGINVIKKTECKTCQTK